MDDENKLLTAKEVAEILKLSINTIYRMSSRRAIPIVRFPGRTVRFKQKDIEEWIKQKTIDALPESQIPKPKYRAGADNDRDK